MTLMLHHAAKSEDFEPFYKSLPVVGRSGTLRQIGRDSSCEGRVHAKSVRIDRVKASCGCLNAKSGQRYAFALMINNYTGEVSPLKAKIVRIWNKMVVL